MEEWAIESKKTTNLKKKAEIALEYLGKTFADVKWWGLFNGEAWPLEKMDMFLDVDIDPLDRITEELVLVGDSWYITWLPDYECFGCWYIPEEPEKKGEPWIWERAKDE